MLDEAINASQLKHSSLLLKTLTYMQVSFIVLPRVSASYEEVLEKLRPGP
jgi:hypothetical protein